MHQEATNSTLPRLASTTNEFFGDTNAVDFAGSTLQTCMIAQGIPVIQHSNALYVGIQQAVIADATPAPIATAVNDNNNNNRDTCWGSNTINVRRTNTTLICHANAHQSSFELPTTLVLISCLRSVNTSWMPSVSRELQQHK